MSKKPQYDPEEIRFPDQHIVESPLVPEMEKSYIEYAMSVIVGRALPDVRDGLKPVHRRILYAMYEDNLTSDKPFKKSATCVGDVLGRYHPHGDASVYDALVRLAQDFSMRYMLVDGHGNFGSVDGDPPAAYRYTEARLSKISNEMLRDIDKETVDWDPNFDETRKEPRVLPSRFPNLLVNGSSGIAVGMATNIPPHNLTEVIDACVCVLDDPEATMADLMDHISGPDFPTGGIIMGRSGIRAAYATGRGKVIVRARTEFEEFGKDRMRIIVTELPYQVNKRQLIKNIAEQVKDKRLDGISDLRDETDRNGMRMVIELKKDANPQVVLNNLFKQTALQSSFGIIMLALVDNQKQPKILSLRQIIDEYLKHQEEILTRRTQYDLRKARERAHLLEGLLIAQDNIDEVIHIIRSAYDDAKQRLMDRFSLDDIQAQAILDMRLKALQGLDREKLQAEYDDLMEKIKYYLELLADENKLKAVLREELIEIRDKFGDKRKTEIQDIEDEIDIEDLIEEETCAFTLSSHGYIKRMPVDTYRTQSRGGRGVNAQNLKEEDFVKSLTIASTHDYILFFTDMGKVHLRKGYQIPEAGRTARGTAIVNVLPLEAGESVTAMVITREFDDNEFLMMVTRKGTVKRIPFIALKTNRKTGIRAITLEEGDHLCDFCGAVMEPGKFEILKDGRERCPECSCTAVRTVRQARELFFASRQQMEKVFGISIRTPIRVRMVNAKTMAKELGDEFVPTRGMDGRALGFARNVRNGRKEICLETGAPAKSLESTIVHELTHIWQYENWGDKVPNDEAHLYVYEGMAVWTEVQYMMSTGDSGRAKRYAYNRLQSNDEYGNGLKAYLERYKVTDAKSLNRKKTPYGKVPPL